MARAAPARYQYGAAKTRQHVGCTLKRVTGCRPPIPIGVQVGLQLAGKVTSGDVFRTRAHSDIAPISRSV
jgi:hypothetical protein